MNFAISRPSFPRARDPLHPCCFVSWSQDATFLSHHFYRYTVRSPVVDLLLDEVNWALTRSKWKVKHAWVVLHASRFSTLWVNARCSKLARPKNSPGSKTSNAQCLTRHLRVRHCENPSPLRGPVLIQYWKPLLKEIFFIFFLCCAHAWLFQSTLEYGDHHLFRFSLV